MAIIREGRLARIGHVSELKDIQQYDVEISFAHAAQAAWFSNLPGISKVTPIHNEQVLQLAVRGDFTALDVSGLSFFFAMVALLISQFTISRGVSAGCASGLVILAFLLDGTERIVNGTWVQYLSLFYYYNLNRPLIPSFNDAPAAALLLLGLSLLLAALSIVLFAGRDSGRPAFVWQRSETHLTNGNHQLVVIFALALALTWSADLENGRLELLLDTLVSRQRMMLERFGAILLVALLTSVMAWLSIFIGAQIAYLSINQGHVLAASFSMLLALIIFGPVYALAGRLRYGAVLGILTVYIALAFLAEFLKALLNVPNWLLSLSIFYQYGNPMTEGMNWGAFLGMTGVAMLLLVIGLVQFRYVDVERG